MSYRFCEWPWEFFTVPKLISNTSTKTINSIPHCTKPTCLPRRREKPWSLPGKKKEKRVVEKGSRCKHLVSTCMSTCTNTHTHTRTFSSAQLFLLDILVHTCSPFYHLEAGSQVWWVSLRWHTHLRWHSQTLSQKENNNSKVLILIPHNRGSKGWGFHMQFPVSNYLRHELQALPLASSMTWLR